MYGRPDGASTKIRRREELMVMHAQLRQQEENAHIQHWASTSVQDLYCETHDAVIMHAVPS